jgi:MYXO-CTERM domain-containing protein
MQERDASPPGGIAALGLAALGVVFSDIGTSPL